MFLMRLPRTPTQAPLASTFESMLATATLRAIAGLAGERLDLDDAFGDLWDLDLEEPPDEVRVGARQDDLDLAVRRP